jgi:hypothetical protein
MPGLLRGVARVAVAAGTATAVSNRVSRRQGRKWAAQDQQNAPQSEDAPPDDGGGNGGGESRISQLKELAALKEQGALTEEEFAAEKARILG